MQAGLGLAHGGAAHGAGAVDDEQGFPGQGGRLAGFRRDHHQQGVVLAVDFLIKAGGQRFAGVFQFPVEQQVSVHGHGAGFRGDGVASPVALRVDGVAGAAQGRQAAAGVQIDMDGRGTGFGGAAGVRDRIAQQGIQRMGRFRGRGEAGCQGQWQAQLEATPVHVQGLLVMQLHLHGFAGGDIGHGGGEQVWTLLADQAGFLATGAGLAVGLFRFGLPVDATDDAPVANSEHHAVHGGVFR